jgi:hypothetical protein
MDTGLAECARRGGGASASDGATATATKIAQTRNLLISRGPMSARQHPPTHAVHHRALHLGRHGSHPATAQASSEIVGEIRAS